MVKQTVTFEDYNGVTRSKDLYFNLNKMEVANLQLREDETYADKLKRVAESNNASLILETLKEFIHISYGEKSDDGVFFIKKRDGHLLVEDFEQSPAYEALIMLLLDDPEKASSFLTNVLPKIPEGTKIPAPSAT